VGASRLPDDEEIPHLEYREDHEPAGDYEDYEEVLISAFQIMGRSS